MGLAELWNKVLNFPILGKAAVLLVIGTPSYFVYDNIQEERKRQLFIREVTEKVYMDIAIGDKFAGRILIGLYGNILPMTCENFISLCRGYQIKDKMIGYKNTMFHKIKPGVAAYGGDVITGLGGNRGMSIYGPFFPDENFEAEFVQEGDLAMVNWGKNTNASQFMITFCKPTIFYGENVVFGTVMKGMKVVRQIADLGTATGRAVLPVRILDCGVYSEENPPALPACATVPLTATMSEEDFLTLEIQKEADRKGTSKEGQEGEEIK